MAAGFAEPLVVVVSTVFVFGDSLLQETDELGGRARSLLVQSAVPSRVYSTAGLFRGQPIGSAATSSAMLTKHATSGARSHLHVPARSTLDRLFGLDVMGGAKYFFELKLGAASCSRAGPRAPVLLATTIYSECNLRVLLCRHPSSRCRGDDGDRDGQRGCGRPQSGTAPSPHAVTLGGVTPAAA